MKLFTFCLFLPCLGSLPKRKGKVYHMNWSEFVKDNKSDSQRTHGFRPACGCSHFVGQSATLSGLV